MQCRLEDSNTVVLDIDDQYSSLDNAVRVGRSVVVVNAIRSKT